MTEEQKVLQFKENYPSDSAIIDRMSSAEEEKPKVLEEMIKRKRIGIHELS